MSVGKDKVRERDQSCRLSSETGKGIHSEDYPTVGKQKQRVVVRPHWQYKANPQAIRRETRFEGIHDGCSPIANLSIR